MARQLSCRSNNQEMPNPRSPIHCALPPRTEQPCPTSQGAFLSVCISRAALRSCVTGPEVDCAPCGGHGSCPAAGVAGPACSRPSALGRQWAGRRGRRSASSREPPAAVLLFLNLHGVQLCCTAQYFKS